MVNFSPAWYICCSSFQVGRSGFPVHLNPTHVDPCMTEDRFFKDEIQKPADFKFSAGVANVFDDMVNRSVPFYGEIQRMIAELAASRAKTGGMVYDLGCATGTTLIGMNTMVSNDVKFIGIDDSPEMLKKCEGKLREAGFTREYELVCADISSNVQITGADVVVLCLTLQFVRPIYRMPLLQRIFEGINPLGALILVEKILAEDSCFNRDFITYYYNYKRRNNYSELEISQKREALENVLIPYKLSENIAVLKEVGFSHCELFFKWYNFTGVIATK